MWSRKLLADSGGNDVRRVCSLVQPASWFAPPYVWPSARVCMCNCILV